MEKITFVNESEPYISAENLNQMQSNIENAIKDTYSTEEKVVGIWIDGKPLYRKTISFNNTLSAGYPIEKEHNISNVSTIFIDAGHSFIVDTSNNKSIPLPTPCSDGNFDDVVGVQVDTNNIYMYAQTTWNTVWQKVVTVNYTKTTD